MNKQLSNEDGRQWLRCSKCGSHYRAGWFKPGAVCGDIFHAGDQVERCDGILLEYEQWRVLGLHQHCPKCEALIIWATTKTGPRIPLDVKPELRFVLRWLDPAETQLGTDVMQTYMAHFTTCPKGAELAAELHGEKP